jgi:hypothetical protein
MEMTEKVAKFDTFEKAKEVAVLSLTPEGWELIEIKEDPTIKIGPATIYLWNIRGRGGVSLSLVLPLPAKITEEIVQWTNKQRGFRIKTKHEQRIEESRFVIAPEDGGYAVWLFCGVSEGVGLCSTSARCYQLNENAAIAIISRKVSI